jgi:hypothetical protein
MSRKRPLTAATWPLCRDLAELGRAAQERASGRKLRLFWCAVVRHAPFAADGQTIWDSVPAFEWFSDRFGTPGLTANVHQVIEAAERWADGQLSAEEWTICAKYHRYWPWLAEPDTWMQNEDNVRYDGSHFREVVAVILDNAIAPEPRLVWTYGRRTVPFHAMDFRREPSRYHPGCFGWICDLIHDLFANPFRPIALDPRWRTSDAVGLARAIYDDRAFDRLPILADALIDAGCDDEQVLAHCRSDGPHVRGCWVVDLVLGKE